MRNFVLAACLFLMVFSGCAPAIPGVVTLTPSATPPPAATQTPLLPDAPSKPPEVTVTPPLATPTEAPSATPTPAAASLTTYNLDVTINYAAKTVDVVQEIIYLNATSDALKDIVLAVEPHQDTGVFEMSALTLNNQPTSEYTFKGQRLALALPAPLQPGGRIKVGINYRINVPLIVQGDPNLVRPKIFGYTPLQMNLVDWYPFVVPYRPGTGWILHAPWTYGEHLVYDQADYYVTLRFTGLDTEPVVAASGEPLPDLGLTHYELKKGRTFAFSISDQFKVLSQQVGEVTVNSYYLSDLFAPGAQAVLDATAKAVQTYTDLFGPYPHKTLAAVQGDFNDGMEYDGLYFLSNAFYNLYDNTEKNYLVMVAAHETSHQWWFGRVANDQSTEPWLDESLATYCERLFYEKNYPADLSWWWLVRVDFYQPSGFIDRGVADYVQFVPYTNATYRMGAHFFEALRQRIGDEAFFAFLKDYATQMEGKIATDDDFFRILRAHTSVDFSDVIAKYFSKAH
jgi:hypothetical protein